MNLTIGIHFLKSNACETHIRDIYHISMHKNKHVKLMRNKISNRWTIENYAKRSILFS